MTEAPPQREGAPALDPAGPRKLLASAPLRVRMAVASAIVLIVGAWLAPAASPTRLAPAPEHAAPLLEEQVQLREIVRPFTGVSEAGLPLAAHAVEFVPSAGTGLHSTGDFTSARPKSRWGGGVRLSDTEVLTHVAALGSAPVVRLRMADGSSESPAEIAAFDPPTGAVLLRLHASRAAAPAIATVPPEVGALTVAAVRTDERSVVIPAFVTGISADRYTVGGVGETLAAGTPIYALGGELLAVATGDGAAYPAGQVVERLRAHATTAGEPALGIAYQSIPGRLSSVFGDRGIVVTRVVAGGPAANAGLLPGDVLLAIHETKVDDVDAALMATRSLPLDTVSVLEVRRAGRVLRVEARPIAAVEVALLAQRDGRRGGLLAGDGLSRGQLERAGISPSDLLVFVNGRAVTSPAQVARELRRVRSAPFAALVEHDGERIFVALDSGP